MTKINYILDWKFNANSGVAKKVLEQVEFWRSNGLNVDLIVITKHHNLKSWQEIETKIEVLSYQASLVRALIRDFIYLRTKKRNHLIYARFGFFTPIQIYSLLRSNYVLELNTLDKFEVKHRNIFLQIYRKLFDKIVLKKAIYIFTVTEEIKLDIARRFQINNVSCVPNSIKFDKEEIEVSRNSRKSIVFVGSPDLPWHGVDKILKIAAKMKDVEFNIVGPKRRYATGENVKFFQDVYGEELKEILKNSTAAISSLSLEVNKMTEACPLKSREYLKLGLPVISSYKDTAFPNGEDFLLQLDFGKGFDPNEAAYKINDFLEFWKNRRVDISRLGSIDQNYVEIKRVEKLSVFFQRN